MRMILPYPPSDNHHMLQKGYKRFPSARYKQFKADVERLMKDLEPYKDNFLEFTVYIVHPDRRKRDIANINKCLHDAIQRCGYLDDDFHIDICNNIRLRDEEGNILIDEDKKGWVDVRIKILPYAKYYKKISLDNYLKESDT